MNNYLFLLNNADNGKPVYVNLAAIAWIVNDGTPNLLVGLNDGSRFHITGKLSQFPPTFTGLINQWP